METLLSEHLAVLYMVATLAGALAHWGKKKVRGEIAGTLVDYFFADHPGRSGFMLGALVLSMVGALMSGALDGVQPLTALVGAFGIGWAIDSGINKGTTAPPDTRQGGFARVSTLGVLSIVSALLVVLLASCGGDFGARVPGNFLERLEAIELAAQQAQRTIEDMTCEEFDNGACTQPDKPLLPGDAARHYNLAASVRSALAAALDIYEGGGSLCFGEARSAEDCLRAAGTTLIEVQDFINREKGN